MTKQVEAQHINHPKMTAAYWLSRERRPKHAVRMAVERIGKDVSVRDVWEQHPYRGLSTENRQSWPRCVKMIKNLYEADEDR